MLKVRRVFSSKKCFNAWLKKNFSCTLSWAFCFTGTTSVCVVDSFCWASASTRTRDSRREEGENDNSGLNHKKTTSDNSQIFACHLYNIEGTYRYGTLQLTRGHNSNSWWSRWIKCIVNWLKTTSRGANLTKKSEKPTDLPQIQYSRQLVASACTAQISHMRRSWHSSFKVN